MKKALLLIILIISLAHSFDYYADISIEVDSSGFTSITGNTNHPSLITEHSSEFTLKDKENWTLNITKDEQFSEFIYSVKLPEGSSINYIKSTGTVNIQSHGETIIISGFGENKSFSIVIQYQVQKQKDSGTLILFLILLIFTALTAFMLIIRKKNTSKKPVKKKHDFLNLPERQKQIMNLIIENRKPMTQAQIQKQLSLPKASASRNIKSLEMKGLIVKENIGVTNLIKLAE